MKEPNKIKTYFLLERRTLIAVGISGIFYNIGMVAGPWFQGQMAQRLLAIARAVAAEPEILLLDEITANLDSATEIYVMEALDKACENRTVLSISHRIAEQNKTAGDQCHIAAHW